MKIVDEEEFVAFGADDKDHGIDLFTYTHMPHHYLSIVYRKPAFSRVEDQCDVPKWWIAIVDNVA